jgi:signal transduction histidine kinase
LFSKRNFTGLQGRISLIFIGVFIVIILPVNSLIYYNLKNLLVEADTRELKAEGERLFSQVRIDPPVLPLPARGYSIFLRVGDQLKTDSLFASPDFPMEQVDIFIQSMVEFDTLKIVTLSRPVEYGNSRLYFSVARSNQRLTAQLTDLKSYLFTANVASILMAGLLVYMVSGFSLRPIKRIIDTAQRINAAKSIERVPVPNTNDENRQLALAINEMLERIENSINNQTSFFASAAHELKTPLTVMHTELSVALQNARGEEAISLIRNQLAEVERLSRVIQDFLLISQLKTATMVLRKNRGLLDEVIYASIKRVRHLIHERQIQMRVTINELTHPYEASFDFDKIETVISNLVENAVKYSVAGSVVHISLGKTEREHCITIENRIDSPIKNLQELKKEFRKSNELSAGLGLGLWICDQLMKLHGGKLEISQEEGVFRASIFVSI